MTDRNTSGPTEGQVSPSGSNVDTHIEGESQLPHTSLSLVVDGLIRWIGSAISWIWLLLVGVIVLNVTMRYVFGEGRVEFEEIQWHIYAFGFLLGLSYCLEADAHVRVDVLYDGFSPKAKAWIELFGICLLLFPFMALVIIYSFPFVTYSISINEVSEAPGGLPARWAIKGVLLLGFLLLALAAFSRLTRVTAALFGAPAAKPAPKAE
ncbi:MAG: TRAP transporter small permease subunit [Alphaproteobacteria bacterium]|nr:TRAP transporter small permease subunit [Alphaproteobacteria bacterium]